MFLNALPYPIAVKDVYGFIQIWYPLIIQQIVIYLFDKSPQLLPFRNTHHCPKNIAPVGVNSATFDIFDLVKTSRFLTIPWDSALLPAQV